MIALSLAAACGVSGADGAPPIVGSDTPCQFQDWMKARNLASNPWVAEALAPHQFMQVPSGWLPLADGSGHFIAIKFDGMQTRGGVLVVFTCDGEHVLTHQFEPSAWINPFPGSRPKETTPSYLTVHTMSGKPGLEGSILTYYRFYRNRLTPVGQLVNREVDLEDSDSAIEKLGSGEWRGDQPDLIRRCLETRRIRRDPITGSWRPDSQSGRSVAQVYRLDKDKLRLVSEGGSCRRP